MTQERHRPVIHMIGHGHIDPTWLWRWTEGYEEVRATFRSALDRMNETPGFKFTSSSACFYAWVKDCDPEMFEEIRARVREGRWELAGGWWVEPDCNIPCGESFARHGLYSQRFFEREFGMRARVGFNPDSFGHAGTFPQLYRKVGIDHYVYMRPCPVFEMDYPGGTTFQWEANDGTRVLTCNLQESYNCDQDTLDRIARLPDNPHLNPGQKHVLGFYGVGNHGGGPTKAAIAQILEAQQRDDLPEVRFSTLSEFFAAFEAEPPATPLPTVTTDLQHHARGCYTVHAEIKRMNRKAEHAVMTAERLAAAAWLLQEHPYPIDRIESAWKRVLYNQFHDILAGTSIESSYEDSRDQLGEARAVAGDIANESMQTLARHVDTSADGNTVMVWNPLPWACDAPVTAPQIASRTLRGPVHLVDADEAPVPVQEVLGERIGHTGYAFTARVPAFGYRCFHVRPGAVAARSDRTLEGGRDFLENDWWRIEFDPDSGQLTRLYDNKNGVEVLRKGNVLAAMVDASDTWGHDVREYRVEAGRFEDASLRLLEAGDVRATVWATSRFRDSRAEQFVTIYRDSDLIDCVFRIDWRESYTMLKLAYETRIGDGVATYDTAYGCQERHTRGGEEPGQQWFDLTGTVDGRPYGFAVLNDCKYGFDVRGGVMRVSLLRSPAYAHHDPTPYDSSLPYAIMDHGSHTVRVRLVPHAGTWQDAGVARRAWELNEPAIAHCESAHTGRLPQELSLLDCDSDHVAMTVLKRSEDGDDLIIRGYETAGRAAQTRIRLPYLDKAFAVEFAPHEIKTLRVNPADWSFREVNLLEE